MSHIVKIYIAIFLSIIISIIYLYISLEKTQETLTQNITKLFVSQAKEFASNIQDTIHHDVKSNIYQTLKSNPKLIEHLESEMATIVTKSYKYIYVLYRDKNGNYKYLLDGSKDEKGEFDEKFGVDNKDIWDEVYNKNISKLIYQEDLDGLWITYLEPIIFNGKTEAIFAIDFSTNLPENVSDAISPLNNIFIYIFIAILIMLIILLYQTFLNLKTKKDSITDPLTQAYNRNYLRDLLKNINISKYQIIMLDIDHFKQVNDTYGHKIGDYILKDVSYIIKQEIREQDIFVRFGGEEFIIFVKRETSDELVAVNVAQRIRVKIQNTNFIYEELSIKVTISMGVTLSPEHFKNISDAIKYADEMLYVAKKEGRNQVIHKSNEIKSDNNNQQMHINSIKESIDNNKVICHYQAIFNAKTNEVAKYEALVRMLDKNNNIIYPNSFLPTILHTNIYNQMTKSILDIVFEKIKNNHVKISVNLNFSDIVNNDIFNIIIKELETNKELAPWLIIELLEYEVIEADDIFTKNINTIKSYGVKIAIDDFGAGFANYNVFQNIPIDTIKIDGSLIKNIDSSDISKTIVKSIIVLTQELNIDTVAEFVHSKEVYEIVKDLGITNMQGFYLAKPQQELIK